MLEGTETAEERESRLEARRARERRQNATRRHEVTRAATNIVAAVKAT